MKHCVNAILFYFPFDSTIIKAFMSFIASKLSSLCGWVQFQCLANYRLCIMKNEKNMTFYWLHIMKKGIVFYDNLTLLVLCQIV